MLEVFILQSDILFKNYLDRLKDHFKISSLNGFLSKEFGSNQINYRQNLRHKILKENPQLNLVEKEKILDLNSRPEVSNSFISISHCKVLGGFIQSSTQVGFDIEQKNRLTDKLISRIADQNELTTCLDPCLLWPAKESSFKVLSRKFEKIVLSDIKIVLSQKEKDIYYFTGTLIKNSMNQTQGLCFSTKDHVFAVSILSNIEKK